jgi:hypothetical protein
MQRIYLVMAAILISLFAYGCGGSGDIADPGAPAGDTGNTNLIAVDTPSSIVGNHSVSLIPGRLDITTAVSDAELDAVLERYGYSLLERDGNNASISVPQGIDLQLAARELSKEYAIMEASPSHLINTPVVSYSQPRMDVSLLADMKSSSYLPLDPMFDGVFFGFSFDGTDGSIVNWTGQANGLNANGFPGAWDVGFSANVSANAVSVAIIDAGWFDYSTIDRADLDEAGQLDAANSGSVDGTGTFTSGLAAAEWDTFDNAGVFTPYRDTGDVLLGIMAALPNNWNVRGFDIDGSGGDLTDTEVWNEGIMGCAPLATYMLVKTGSESGGNWTFSDAELAASIDHAVASGAKVILLGMFGTGSPGAALSAALQNANDNNVLCIAPAGDVVNSFNGTDFDETAVDITVTDITPASDPNCVAVSATGPNRFPYAGGVDVTGDSNPDFDNPNTGWFPRWAAPFAERFFEVPLWSNTGGDIAACSVSIGFGPHPFLINGADVIPGNNYNNNISRFSTSNAAAYVAGAAAMTCQALTAANGGTPPSDEEVLQVLMDTTQNEFVDLLGLVDNPLTPDPGDGGLLSASGALNAVAGGGVSGPSMSLSVPTGQLVPATLLTTFQLAPQVSGGTGPFDLSIDWNNGAAPVVVNNWVNQDPVALTGGWDTLGKKTILISVTETTGDMRTSNRTVEVPVYNAVSTSLTVMGPIDPGDPGLGEKLFTPAQAIQDAVTYTYSSNVANVFTGSVNGVPNNPQFGWDFDGDDVVDKVGSTVEHAFINTGSFNIKFIVTQDLFPDISVTRTVLVN